MPKSTSMAAVMVFWLGLIFQYCVAVVTLLPSSPVALICTAISSLPSALSSSARACGR